VTFIASYCTNIEKYCSAILNIAEINLTGSYYNKEKARHG
jgi:hypothetical protein